MKDFNAPQNIVPFGKYKGQPVEVLAQDKGYLDWLSAQDWFRERYKGIYTLIVNNFTEASETPEHNSLQVMFLDEAFCFSFVQAAASDWLAKVKTEPILEFRKLLSRQLKDATQELEQCAEQWQKKYSGKPTPAVGHALNWYENDTRALQRLAAKEKEIAGEIAIIPDNLTYSVKVTKEFEARGIDVVLNALLTSEQKIMRYYVNQPRCAHTEAKEFRIEIKPIVSDDYPAILRQMKASGSKYLFTKAYTWVGATKDQFVQTMQLSGIKVVFLEDINSANP